MSQTKDTNIEEELAKVKRVLRAKYGDGGRKGVLGPDVARGARLSKLLDFRSLEHRTRIASQKYSPAIVKITSKSTNEERAKHHLSYIARGDFELKNAVGEGLGKTGPSDIAREWAIDEPDQPAQLSGLKAEFEFGATILEQVKTFSKTVLKDHHPRVDKISSKNGDNPQLILRVKGDDLTAEELSSLIQKHLDHAAQVSEVEAMSGEKSNDECHGFFTQRHTAEGFGESRRRVCDFNFW